MATAANDCWSMDFLSDQLFDGRKIRVLAIVDKLTRLSPAIDVRLSYRGADVVQTLERVASVYGRPKRIRVDNGPEFISKELDLWAWLHGVELDFSRPGKPTDNAFAESFNGKFRDECLNAYWFLSLDDARLKCEAWRRVDIWLHHTHLAMSLMRRDFAVRVLVLWDPLRVVLRGGCWPWSLACREQRDRIATDHLEVDGSR